MIIYGSDLAKICSARAAILPYTIVYDHVTKLWNIKIMLGVDKKSGEITDTGGGVKSKTDLNNLAASFREFTEETKGIFSKTITIDKLLTCVAVTQSQHRRIPVIRNPRVKLAETSTPGVEGVKYDTGGMSTIFLPVDNKLIEATKHFDEIGEHPDGEEHNELSELLWVSESEFLDLIQGKSVNGKYMWPKLQKFYQTAYTEDIRGIMKVRYWWTPASSACSGTHTTFIGSTSSECTMRTKLTNETTNNIVVSVTSNVSKINLKVCA